MTATAVARAAYMHLKGNNFYTWKEAVRFALKKKGGAVAATPIAIGVIILFVALGGVVASSLPSAASAAGTSGETSGGHALSAGVIGVVGAVVVGLLAGLVNRGRDRRPTWR